MNWLMEEQRDFTQSRIGARKFFVLLCSDFILNIFILIKYNWDKKQNTERSWSKYFDARAELKRIN